MLVSELSGLLNGFPGEATRIRCFAHILNLVVKVDNPFFVKLNLNLTRSDRQSYLSSAKATRLLTEILRMMKTTMLR
jgi:hypothetical protein